MKKMSLILLASLLMACSTPATDDNKNVYCEVGDDDCSGEVLDYESYMDGEHSFKTITMQNAIDIFENKGSGIIYFGFPDCPWCIEALPVMDEVAKELGKEILYVQTRDADRNLIYTPEEKAKILTYVGEYEDKDEEGNLGLYVPLVVVVKDGECVSGHLGTIEEHDAHERTMTSDEIASLTEIYTEMFK